MTQYPKMQLNKFICHHHKCRQVFYIRKVERDDWPIICPRCAAILGNPEPVAITVVVQSIDLEKPT